MRHVLIITLLAVFTSSLSLTAEARRYHHHYHHYHRHHHRHVYYRHLAYHRHAYHAHVAYPLLHSYTAKRSHSRHALVTHTRVAGPGKQLPLNHPPSPSSSAPASLPAPVTGNQAQKTAPQNRTASIPAWKYPPQTVKPVPAKPQHLLKPDTNSFVIIPGYRVDK